MEIAGAATLKGQLANQPSTAQKSAPAREGAGNPKGMPAGTRVRAATPLSEANGNGGQPRDIRAGRSYWLGTLLNRDSHRRIGRVSALVAIDLAGIYLALLSALALKALARDDFDLSQVPAAANEFWPLAAMVVVLLFAARGLYGRREQRPGFAQVLSGLFQATLITALFALVSDSSFSSYYLFYGSLLFAVIYVGGLRQAYEAITFKILREAVGYRRRVVLVGTGDEIERVAKALRGSPNSAYEPVGFVSPTPIKAGTLRSLGTLDDLPDRVSEHAVDEIVIADPDFPQDRAVELIDFCHQHGVTVRIAPTTMEVLAQRAEFVPGEGVPLFELRPPVLEGLEYVGKRAFDVVVSALLLMVLSPLLLAIALAVRLTSRGPAFHRGLRAGIGEKPFACLKFRTMFEDAEHRQASLEELNEMTGALFKIRNDPRLTRVGRFLRSFSLDELPQLINVVRGEMSLVGPRPLTMRDFDRLDDWHRRRYLVLPGMTGLWQVSGRSDLDFDDLVRLDFLYIETWSIFTDTAILVKTIPAVLRRHGAY